MSNSEQRKEFRDIVALVVEDNEFLRTAVGRVLKEIGIQDVRFVRTEDEGLRAFAEHAAHVVIVEFGHEYEPAYEMLKKLQQSPHCTHGTTGLIALVPESNRKRVLKAHDAGAEAVVAEPFSRKELEAHVRVIAERHMAYSAARSAADGGQAADSESSVAS